MLNKDIIKRTYFTEKNLILLCLLYPFISVFSTIITSWSCFMNILVIKVCYTYDRIKINQIITQRATTRVEWTLLTTKKKPMLIILAVRGTLWWANPLLSNSCWEMTSPTPIKDPGGQTGDRYCVSDHWARCNRWSYSCGRCFHCSSNRILYLRHINSYIDHKYKQPSG